MRALICEGQCVRLSPATFSMWPLLSPFRDSVTVEKARHPLKKDDIALYTRPDGMHIMHRVYRVKRGSETYYMLGDAQSGPLEPVKAREVYGRVAEIERKGRVIALDSTLYKLYCRLWRLLRPVRGGLYAAIGRMLRRRKKGNAHEAE